MRRTVLILVLSLLGASAATSAWPQEEPWVMEEPDGRIFTVAPDKGAQHAGTGFVCPEKINGVARRGLFVFDTSDHGRDVACGYGKPGTDAWYTIILTKLELKTSKEVFDRNVLEEQRADPVVEQATAPLAPGLPPLPERAAFWKTRSGKIDGLWFATIGSWHVQLVTTFQPDRQGEVVGMAKTVWAQVFDQVRGPET